MKYDQHENCAKCGYPGKTVQYAWAHLPTLEEGVGAVEELRLTCTRCGFKWFRDCLDKEKA